MVEGPAIDKSFWFEAGHEILFVHCEHFHCLTLPLVKSSITLGDNMPQFQWKLSLHCAHDTPLLVFVTFELHVTHLTGGILRSGQHQYRQNQYYCRKLVDRIVRNKFTTQQFMRANPKLTVWPPSNFLLSSLHNSLDVNVFAHISHSQLRTHISRWTGDRMDKPLTNFRYSSVLNQRTSGNVWNEY